MGVMRDNSRERQRPLCTFVATLRPSRPPILAAVLVAVSVLCGCYGSTEPAGDIGIDRATLTA